MTPEEEIAQIVEERARRVAEIRKARSREIDEVYAESKVKLQRLWAQLRGEE